MKVIINPFVLFVVVVLFFTGLVAGAFLEFFNCFIEGLKGKGLLDQAYVPFYKKIRGNGRD